MGTTLSEVVRDAKGRDPVRLMREVLDLTFFPYLEAMYGAALDLCASCDIVVGGSASWCVKAATLTRGVPYAGIHFYPGVFRSRHAPPPGLGLPAWGWLNRPTWALLDLAMDMAFRAPAARFFAAKGLPPIRHAIPDAMFSDRLNLLAASPAFWPPAPDWSPIHHLCGDFVMPAQAEPWAPSQSFRSFVEAGPPPVLLSMGSMEQLAPGRTRDLLIGSARQAGVRAIIQSKTSDDEGRDGDLYFLRWAPHRDLLPMCSAMVHHGGAGTTHSALRAGRPSVVLPFIFEQKLWARQLQDVGAADECISFWKATPERVGRKIRHAIASEPLRARASELASLMAHEDGTGVATRLLEQLATREGRPRTIAPAPEAAR
jgi:sterol 3beta-glucosyltransferase